MKVGVIDYGAGNLFSVQMAFQRAGADCALLRTPEEVLAAERLVLPGVGAAGAAMAQLQRAAIPEALYEAVRVKGRPLLGICLGMQLMAATLHEYGTRPGLGWIEGDVVDLHSAMLPGLRIPHMGWNGVSTSERGERFFHGIRGERIFYFAHSFVLQPSDTSVVAATVDIGAGLTAAIQFDSVLATQFHPEKSHVNGERLIQTFLEWSP